MKLLLYVAFMFLLQYATAQRQKLFLTAGQSNAVGMGDSAVSIKPVAGKTFEYRFTGNELKPLKDPVGYNEFHFQQANTGSLWPAFANEYCNLTGNNVVVVPAARGGSSCHKKAELSDYGTWDTTGSLPLFDSAVIKAKAALKKTGAILSGIIWSQGERDANAINTKQLSAEEYSRAMEGLINRFRKIFGAHTNFYIIQTGFYTHHPQEGFTAVRSAQEGLAKKMKRVYIVYSQTGSFSDRGWMKDEIHYSQPALNDIGKEVARQIMQIEKR
jgi:hypothetical protein